MSMRKAVITINPVTKGRAKHHPESVRLQTEGHHFLFDIKAVYHKAGAADPAPVLVAVASVYNGEWNFTFTRSVPANIITKLMQLMTYVKKLNQPPTEPFQV